MWNIGKLGTRTSSTLQECVMYGPPRRLRHRTNLFVILVWYKELMTYCCVTILKFRVQSKLRSQNIIVTTIFMWIIWTTLSNYSFAYGSAWSYDAGAMRCWLQFLLERDWDAPYLLFGTSEFCYCYRWARRIFEDWRVEQLLGERAWWGCCLFHAWEAMVESW